MKFSPAFMFVALATILSLCYCSKTNHLLPTGTGSIGDINSITKIDSIARTYGFSRSLDSYDSLPRKSMSVSEFLTLMKNTNTPVVKPSITTNNDNHNVKMVEDVVTDTSNVSASGTANPAILSSNNGPYVTAGSLTYNFTYLSSRAYPSVYQITVLINTDGEGAEQAYGIGGSTFDYTGVGSPLPEVQWTYTNRGGVSHGYANVQPGFYVTCYGTEREVLTIAGYTYTKVYNVTFNISGQLFVQFGTYATITMTKVS